MRIRPLRRPTLTAPVSKLNTLSFNAHLLAWLNGRAGDGLCLIAGGVFALGFAPFEWRVCAWLSLAVLFVALTPLKQGVHLTGKRALWRGFLWGVGAYSAGVHWVFNSIHDFGGASVTASVVFTVALVLYMALYPALCAWGLRWLAQRTSHALVWALAFALLWPVTEWLRAWVLTGFPWLMFGFALVDTPFAGFMPFVGSLGASAIAVLCVALSALVVFHATMPRVLALLCVMATFGVGQVLVYGQSRYIENHHTQRIDVAAVQGNIPQNVKMNPKKLGVSLTAYDELTAQTLGADMIVWPETAIPTFITNVPDYVQRMAEQVRTANSALVLGAFIPASNRTDYHNGIWVINREDVQAYKKHQLVPFGEYMPLRWAMQVFEQFVDIPRVDMIPGDIPDAPVNVAGIPTAPHICYETAYPDVIRPPVQAGAQLLINISNDAWFGKLIAPHQHLEMARVRAIEFAKPMVRATNTGISALINASGEVVQSSAQEVPAVVRDTLTLNNAITPFTRIGQWCIGWVLLGALLLLCFVCKRFDRAKG